MFGISFIATNIGQVTHIDNTAAPSSIDNPGFDLKFIRNESKVSVFPQSDMGLQNFYPIWDMATLQQSYPFVECYLKIDGTTPYVPVVKYMYEQMYPAIYDKVNERLEIKMIQP